MIPQDEILNAIRVMANSSFRDGYVISVHSVKNFDNDENGIVVRKHYRSPEKQVIIDFDDYKGLTDKDIASLVRACIKML